MLYATARWNPFKVDSTVTNSTMEPHWSQGREVEPRVGPCVVQVRETLYSNLLVSTQVYEWVPANRLGR